LLAEAAALVDPEVVSALLHQGKLVRVSEDVLFLRETYEDIVAQITAHIRRTAT